MIAVYISVLIACMLLVYSVIPNILVRVFHIAVLWRGPREPVVALTFDDGPDANFTPRVLDALKRCNVQATFFVIAEKAVAHPDIVRRMQAEGHEVQIHGWAHAFVPLLPPKRTLQQVVQSAHALRERFGIVTSLYRPTWGLCNAATLLSGVLREHRLVTWSVMVGDWRVQPGSVILRRIMQKVHPGAVIVLHDSDETRGAESGAPNHVIEMLPELAKEIRQRGYQFQPLSKWRNKAGRPT